MNKIYLSGNYVIVEKDGNVYEYPRTLSVYTLEGSNYVIKERIDDGQFVIPIAQIGTYFDEAGAVAYTEATLVTFLRENTGFKTAGGGSPADPDAQAFITAASITDPTQQSAINQLVVDLKGYSIWSKFSALYPMVGGSATKHSYNLKNTAQYQIVWNGGVTHSNLGVQFGGVNGWGNTDYNLSTNASLNSHSISVYSRTTGTSSFQCELGVTGGIFEGGAGIFLRASGLTYYRVNSQASYITYSDADSRGFYLANRTASNVVNGWRNSTKVVTGTTVSYTPLANFNYSIGAFNENGVNTYYSAKQIAFASIGQGLTDTEAANFYTAVQAFNTTLSRQV